jgi:VanZ family protein
MGLIFHLSAQPRLPRVMPPGLPQIQDVLGHFSVYAALAVLLWWALRGAGVRRQLLWAFVLAVLYGLTDEYHQRFVPNRHPDLFDLATDAAGALVALLIVKWVAARRPRAADRGAAPDKPDRP